MQVSIDILTVLVRWSSVPLSDLLVSQIFPAVVQCTLHTDDSSTMQVYFDAIFSFRPHHHAVHKM